MRYVLGLLAGMLLAAPAFAGQGAELARQHLYAGTYAEGRAVLSPLAEAGDAEARFGLGLLQLGDAMGAFWGTLLGYGLVLPGSERLEALRRQGVSPEALSYDALRDVLQRFIDDLAAARETLVSAADAGGDWVIELDLARLRLDLDGDGRGSEAESLAALAGAVSGEIMFGPVPVDIPELLQQEQAEGRRGGVAAEVPSAAAPARIGFDRADGYWLAGYTQALSVPVDFLLAHDFQRTFDAVGHRLFDSPVFALSGASEAGSLFMDPRTDGQIADLIAAIHTINWEVVDRPRLARIQGRLHGITSMSRRNWDAIVEETDDRRELVPSPRQTALMPEAKVTDDMVVAWRETLDTVDRVIDGRLLLPHWRFSKGISLDAYFKQTVRTDMVMLLTGIDMLPLLRDGPIADAEAFAAANRVFGNDLWSYVFWFN